MILLNLNKIIDSP